MEATFVGARSPNPMVLSSRKRRVSPVIDHLPPGGNQIAIAQLTTWSPRYNRSHQSTTSLPLRVERYELKTRDDYKRTIRRNHSQSTNTPRPGPTPSHHITPHKNPASNSISAPQPYYQLTSSRPYPTRSTWQAGCTHPDDEQQETDAQQKLGPLDFNRLVLPFRPER